MGEKNAEFNFKYKPKKPQKTHQEKVTHKKLKQSMSKSQKGHFESVQHELTFC